MNKKTGTNNQMQAYFKNFLNRYSMYLFLAIITITFSITTKGVLLRPLNITNIILQNSYIFTLSIGMLILIVIGHIDLSVGSVSGFIGAMAAIMMLNMKLSPVLAILISLCFGIIVGAFQGFWVAYVKVPSFIATLAGMLIFKGLMVVVTQGKTIGPFPPIFQKISSGFVPDYFGTNKYNVTALVVGVLISVSIILAFMYSRKKKIQYSEPVESLLVVFIKIIILVFFVMAFFFILSKYEGIPNVLIFVMLFVGLYHFITNKTVIGRHIYAIGGNEKAAALSGINTKKVVLFMFMNMGFLSAISGIIFTARLNAATPTAGDGFELDAIAACYIGGASAYGGTGTISGAIIGGLVMGFLNNGMSLMSIGSDWQKTIKGIVLLLVVAFDVYSKSKSSNK